MSANDTKKFYWLKLHKDFFKRHEIRIVEDMPNGKDYVLFYLKLLVESVSHEGRLRFSDTIPYNESMLASLTNTNIDTVRSAMKIFTELNMIEMLDDATIHMIEVREMIGSETGKAQRMREYRGKVKATGELQAGYNVAKSIEIRDKSLENRDKRLDKEEVNKVNKEKIIKKESPPKTQYREFVSMTETEYQTLCNKYGKDGADEMLDILDNFKGSNGKKYLSDYRAILSWVVDKWKDKYKVMEPQKERMPHKEFIAKTAAKIAEKLRKEKEDNDTGQDL